MIFLPEKFTERMKNVLGGEFDAFLKCYDLPPQRGIRINTLKMPLEKRESMPFELAPSPFAKDSFFLLSDDEKIGASPYHHAGAIYSQEPSASAAAAALRTQPSEIILDMCAAPGGKTTQIAAALQGKGLIWANEVISSRASVLISNVERMGIKNCIVSSARPDTLAENLPEYFDRVIVDAPCSGEGMFRKNPRAVEEWSPEHVSSCARRQAQIMESACRCLRPGGTLVYSTCTFSPEEDENLISEFLENHPDFYADAIDDIPAHKVPVGAGVAVKIYPTDGGEGHFVARLIRRGECEYGTSFAAVNDRTNTETRSFFDGIFSISPDVACKVIGENIYAVPKDFPDVRGCGVLRAGVLAGKIKGKRIEPSHALFMAYEPEMFKNTVDLTETPSVLSAFLRGEEIACDGKLKGYTAVVFDNMTIGFGKSSGGRLKNHYPKGLRSLN